jgi:D-glycero-alpha-D-manno-heptose-7-phosphate kinase
MLIARTPVRISFAGGGTDLPSYYEKYGGAVLSGAINKYFYTILTERDDRYIQIISSDLKKMAEADHIDFTSQELTEQELDIPFAVLRYFQCHKGVNLFLASEVPPGTGLGSSASVCVNMVKLISQYLEKPMSRYDMAETAFHIATKMLNRPVGKQDEYAATFGSLNLLEFEPSGHTRVEPIQVDSEIIASLEKNILLFFTGRSHNSTEILSVQKSSSEKGEEATVLSLTRLKELVMPMKESLVRGDLDTFGHLLDECWRFKKKVSNKITNARIDELYEMAKRNGALGGKITGAGGGGFLMFYCPAENQPRLRRVMLQNGIKEMSFRFDFQGSQIVHDDPFFGASGRGSMLWRLTRTSEPQDWPFMH